MKNIIVIFGAPDFESEEVRKIARDLGFTLATATYKGERVTSSNAYLADGFVVDEGLEGDFAGAVVFECSLESAGDIPVMLWCDHHREGDPGYNASAQDFWLGSSIGQFCNCFGVEPRPHILFVAAADHCPGHAYQELCPGIDPEDFRNFRMIQKVEGYKKNINTLHKAKPELLEVLIKNAQEIILSAPTLTRGIHMLRYGVDEAVEAALQLGVGILFEKQEGEHFKLSLKGFCSFNQVESFISWAQESLSSYLVGEPYGNPHRGYAGVRLSKSFFEIAKETSRKSVHALL